MQNPVSSVRQEFRAALQWQQMLFLALHDRPEGMFAKEFLDWFVAGENLLGTRVPDLASREDDKAMREVMKHHAGLGVRWKLLSSTWEYPDRVYGDGGILGRRYIKEEPCLRLTEKGRRVAAYGQRRKVLFYLPRVLLLALEVYRKRWAGPIAFVAGLAGFLRFFLMWEPARAVLGAASVSAMAYGVRWLLAARRTPD